MNNQHILKPALDYIPPDLVSISDYERYARHFIRDDIWAYISGGAADEHTLAENLQSFARQPIYNRVLSDFSTANTRTRILGYELDSPLLLAPVAHQRLLHPYGEIATAQAAAAMNVPLIVSTLSSVALEQIAQHAGQWWFQLYWQPQREDNQTLLRRAIQADARAIVITLDAPVSGVRNRAQRAGFRLPDGVREENLVEFATSVNTAAEGESVIFKHFMKQRPSLDDLKWLREQTSLPLLAKGISHPEDAKALQEIGFDGLIISNHGGRTLDGVPATLSLLPAIRIAVGKDMTLLMDSGIRRGTDVVKALAAGADAVCIGRPQLWSLAVAGALGVAHMLRIFQEELEMAMALTGCATIDAISQDVFADRF